MLMLRTAARIIERFLSRHASIEGDRDGAMIAGRANRALARKSKWN